MTKLIICWPVVNVFLQNWIKKRETQSLCREKCFPEGWVKKSNQRSACKYIHMLIFTNNVRWQWRDRKNHVNTINIGLRWTSMKPINITLAVIGMVCRRTIKLWVNQSIVDTIEIITKKIEQKIILGSWYLIAKHVGNNRNRTSNTFQTKGFVEPWKLKKVIADDIIRKVWVPFEKSSKSMRPFLRPNFNGSEYS